MQYGVHVVYVVRDLVYPSLLFSRDGNTNRKGTLYTHEYNKYEIHVTVLQV